MDEDSACQLSVQKSVITDLQLGIKNICLGEFRKSEKRTWLQKQIQIPEVLEAVKMVPIATCGSKNDKIKLLLLKGGFYAIAIELVSWKNRPPKQY